MNHHIAIRLYNLVISVVYTLVFNSARTPLCIRTRVLLRALYETYVIYKLFHYLIDWCTVLINYLIDWHIVLIDHKLIVDCIPYCIIMYCILYCNVCIDWHVLYYCIISNFILSYVCLRKWEAHSPSLTSTYQELTSPCLSKW